MRVDLLMVEESSAALPQDTITNPFSEGVCKIRYFVSRSKNACSNFKEIKRVLALTHVPPKSVKSVIFFRIKYISVVIFISPRGQFVTHLKFC